jgi:hypothetical protein
MSAAGPIASCRLAGARLAGVDARVRAFVCDGRGKPRCRDLHNQRGQRKHQDRSGHCQHALDREVLDIDGKETCKRGDGDVEQEQHREAIGLEVDAYDRSQLEVDEEKQDVVEFSASSANHFQVVRPGGPDNRGADHEQRDELKAAHQPISKPVKRVFDVPFCHDSLPNVDPPWRALPPETINHALRDA